MKKFLRLLGAATLAATLIPYAYSKNEETEEETLKALLWKMTSKPDPEVENKKKLELTIGFNVPSFKKAAAESDLFADDLTVNYHTAPACDCQCDCETECPCEAECDSNCPCDAACTYECEGGAVTDCCGECVCENTGEAACCCQETGESVADEMVEAVEEVVDEVAEVAEDVAEEAAEVVEDVAGSDKAPTDETA